LFGIFSFYSQTAIQTFKKLNAADKLLHPQMKLTAVTTSQSNRHNSRPLPPTLLKQQRKCVQNRAKYWLFFAVHMYLHAVQQRARNVVMLESVTEIFISDFRPSQF